MQGQVAKPRSRVNCQGGRLPWHLDSRIHAETMHIFYSDTYAAINMLKILGMFICAKCSQIKILKITNTQHAQSGLTAKAPALDWKIYSGKC
jgi:hypothetical protein